MVQCRCADKPIKARLIWRNENYEIGNDLAILEPLEVLPHFYFSEISTKYNVLQTVFAAGFPIYSDRNEFNPSIYQGHITKCNRNILQHDATVLNGQSGGPLFDDSGRVLGICVSTMINNNENFQQMSISIPLALVKSKLEIFNKSRGWYLSLR